MSGLDLSPERESLMNTRSFSPCTSSWRAGSCLFALMLAVLSLPVPASSQGSAGSAASQAAQQYVRVKRGANMHKGPDTQPEVLFMLPGGIVLPVVERVGRDGVWIAVRITPEVRKRATRMRWRNEERGYVHLSTVEFVKAES